MFFSLFFFLNFNQYITFFIFILILANKILLFKIRVLLVNYNLKELYITLYLDLGSILSKKKKYRGQNQLFKSFFFKIHLK